MFLEPVGYVAIPVDESNCHTTLVRRDSEIFAQLLSQHVLAVSLAFAEEIFIDEVDVPPPKRGNSSTHAGYVNKQHCGHNHS